MCVTHIDIVINVHSYMLTDKNFQFCDHSLVLSNLKENSANHHPHY